jgi:hypothetical protein
MTPPEVMRELACMVELGPLGFKKWWSWLSGASWLPEAPASLCEQEEEGVWEMPWLGGQNGRGPSLVSWVPKPKATSPQRSM